MESLPYPLRIPKKMIELAQLRSRQYYVDKSAALRQLMHLGAEEYALDLVSEGRISLGKAAELLNLSVHDLYRLAEKHGTELGATAEQQKKSAEAAKRLVL